MSEVSPLMRLAESSGEARAIRRKESRWSLWNEAAFEQFKATEDQLAMAEFIEEEGQQEEAAVMRNKAEAMLDEVRWSCEIASGTNDQDVARVMAAKFIFDAEEIE